jgi:hypothetical protein
MMTVESRSSFPFEAPPPPGPVRVTANRNQLNARFQVLGFTVHSGGRPFFEVILTTERRLFDPANAGQRTTSNFYESRRDNNLIRAENEGSLFVVPASVVGAFAAQANEIFYTAAGYDSAQGANPVYAQPLDQLVAGAPSVAIAEDMRTKTMSAVLSVRLDRLLRVRESDVQPSHRAFDAGVDAADDRVEGEDGYDTGAQAFDYDDGYENAGGYQTQSYVHDEDAAVSLGDDDAGDDLSRQRQRHPQRHTTTRTTTITTTASGRPWLHRLRWKAATPPARRHPRCSKTMTRASDMTRHPAARPPTTTRSPSPPRTETTTTPISTTSR